MGARRGPLDLQRLKAQGLLHGLLVDLQRQIRLIGSVNLEESLA